MEKIKNDLMNNGSTSNKNIKDAKKKNDNAKPDIGDNLHKKIKNLLDKLQNSDLNDANRMDSWQKHIKKSKQAQNAAKRLSSALQESFRQNFEKVKGELSGDAIEYLKKILKIKINWEDILSKAINTTLERSSSKRWNYPNIYYRHIRYLPSDDIEETFGNITCFVDTSASMSTEELQKIFGIIFDAMQQNEIKTITIVQHDYDLQSIDVIDVEDIHDTEDLVDKVAIKGRGGTSHRIPYDQFMKILNDEIEIELGEFDEIPEPDIIIFMSDFESDFDEIYDKLKKEFPFYCISTSVKPCDSIKSDEWVKIE